MVMNKIKTLSVRQILAAKIARILVDNTKTVHIACGSPACREIKMARSDNVASIATTDGTRAANAPASPSLPRSHMLDAWHQ